MKARRREVNYPLALWRRRWLILPFVLIGLIVALVLFSRMIRLYRTGATVILVSQSISDQVYARGWRPPPANRLKLIQLEVTSNAFLEKVAKAMKQETPESEPLKLQQLGRLVSVVEIDPETWIFQCVSPDPRKAAQRANVFARTFVEHSRSKKVQVTEGSADLLKDEVGRLEQDLREEKERLARYQAEHRGELPSDREALRAEQTFLRTRLVELDGRIDARKKERAERVELLRNPSAAEGKRAAPGLLPAQDPRLEQERDLRERLAQARLRYTDQHPDVVRLRSSLDALLDDLARNPPSVLPSPAAEVGMPPVPAPAGNEGDLERFLRLEISRLDDEIKELDGQRNQAQGRIAAIEERIRASFLRQSEIDRINASIGVIEGRLLRNQDRLQNLETEKEIFQRGMDERFELKAEAPVPVLPFRPDLLQLLMLWTGIGAGTGAGLAILLELLDRAVWTADEIEDLLGIEVLASVPNMDKIGRKRLARPPEQAPRKGGARA